MQEPKVFLRWPETELLHNAANKNLALDRPVIYAGKIKLHGTNVGIHVTASGSVYTQSRNELHSCHPAAKYAAYGFPYWAHRNADYFRALRPASMTKGPFVIYGEWCGRNINSGAAVCKIYPRFLAVFAVRTNDTLTIDPAKIEEILSRGSHLVQQLRERDLKEQEGEGELPIKKRRGKREKMLRRKAKKQAEKRAEEEEEEEEEETEEINLNDNDDHSNEEEQEENEGKAKETTMGKPEKFRKRDDRWIDRLYVIPFYANQIVLDFSDPKEMASQLDYVNKAVDLVDLEDPFIKENFAISGTGEGIVWYPISMAIDGVIPLETFANLFFKTKGESHAVRKLRYPAQLTPDAIRTIEEFVDAFVTEGRMRQAMHELQLHIFLRSEMGRFVAWVTSDVRKESKMEVEQSRLLWGAIEEKVKRAATKWYLEGVMKTAIEDDDCLRAVEKARKRAEDEQKKDEQYVKKKSNKNKNKNKAKKNKQQKATKATRKRNDNDDEEEEDEDQGEYNRRTNMLDLLGEAEA